MKHIDVKVGRDADNPVWHESPTPPEGWVLIGSPSPGMRRYAPPQQLEDDGYDDMRKALFSIRETNDENK